MSEFLLEVGCEELPAFFVEKAFKDLANQLSKELGELGVKNSEPVAMGTPRRLIVSFASLAPRQADAVKEQRGPSLSAAYDADGKPTGALQGFCKSQGVSVDDLRKDDQYVWVTKQIPGRPTKELLAEILPRIILGLSFEKSMRWGKSRVRFARPIRWILAAYDGDKVEFDVEGVESDILSYGHRFYSPGKFKATSLEKLKMELRERNVEPDPYYRREIILQETEKVANGVAEISDDLLEENVYLTEWPTAIRGEFDLSFLELPEPVLVTAMAKHERMFPIRNAEGKLTNSFVFIRNSGEDKTVQRGCEWVLGARFNDARFFYEQDQKLKLDDFLAKTNDILFQASLGTVRQRAERLANLAPSIVNRFHFGGKAYSEVKDELQAMMRDAEKAGLYSKADLATGLVSELSSLQGVIGAEYGKREGFNDAVCNAIAAQYKTPSSSIDGVTAALLIADQVDKLAGYLGLGLEPTGSSDPFGLRKAVTVLIRVSENYDDDIPHFTKFINTALDEYQRQGIELDRRKAFKGTEAIFEGRYQALYDEFPHDVFAAALSQDGRITCTPRKMRYRLETLNSAKSNSLLVQAATRPINIVRSAKEKSFEFALFPALNEAGLDSPEAAALLAAMQAIEKRFDFSNENIIEILESLVAPINAFFDNTMIMVEDVEVRAQRLGLASAVADYLLEIGDFTKLEA
ncbi:MAG TPA: glycine--tRNA ligase subunit beta [Fimbriimonas sp.]|nr:glycine--tRNA ligase subunit beta [Fimbriimonas sp.]